VDDKFKNIDRMLTEAEWEVEEALMVLGWELKRFRTNLELLLETVEKPGQQKSS
jgi:hypothetical protein